ncbi:hypothetical protein F383_23966 [Gossypium arboreum]|uniref:Uncharacterized protein n=1 Tax=Gossypium arboreum TaxID=29729 RepID=A0A0B0MQI2_GOSAR|nr:hypothetical protein F383_23966 [Gossypium arboreum]
MVYSFALMQ